MRRRQNQLFGKRETVYGLVNFLTGGVFISFLESPRDAGTKMLSLHVSYSI